MSSTVNVVASPDGVVGEVHIGAPPERVFEALTDPRQVSRWWGQRGMYLCTKFDADLRPGGKWRTEGVTADGRTYVVEGEYREVDPPRALAYTWVTSWHQHAPTLVRWELKPSGDGTDVKMMHSGLKDYPEARKDYSGGWPRVLAWLQGFCEQGTTAQTRPVDPELGKGGAGARD